MFTIVLIITLVYAFVILSIAWGYYKLSKTTPNKTKNSKISIVIAARDEEKNIEKCISSIVNQNFLTEHFEIIIVNDHSNDKTVEIIDTLIKSNSNIRLLNLTDTYSKKEAIKVGVNLSKHSLIATTDADCILPKNWLNTISQVDYSNYSLLIGPLCLKDKKGFLNSFQQLDIFALQGITFGTVYYNMPTLCSAANLVFSKTDYLECSNKINNNSPSGDDVFLMEQLLKKDKKIIGNLNRDFIVETEPENTLLDFFNQRIRWASKSKFYTNKPMIFLSILIFITNVVAIFIYSQIVFVDKNKAVYIILLLTKWLVDFILLFLVASFSNKKMKMINFIPVQILYPIYILSTVFLSTFISFNWKGRVYNG